ncbi:MAG: hypothetical protein J2P15_15580 [Micromonosporaceae bacterium]|nr:hypothetical protein [Micromonosporaceae bacterium]
MSAAILIGYVAVPLFGVFLCVAPVVSRPTIQFGVRVPPERVAAPVIGRERHRYIWRSAAIAVAATAVVLATGARAPFWLSWIILVLLVATDAALFWWAHRRIGRVKSAEGWFAGRRQTVVTDTGWRTEPARFPATWLLPAVAVIAAAAVVGILRYPQLPAHLNTGRRSLATTPASAFATLIGQAYVTGLWVILLSLAFRFRPDLDTGDPAGSLRRYRQALALIGRAGLIFVACIDLTFALAALRRWQIADLRAGLVILPATLGLAGLLAVVVHAGRIRARAGTAAAGSDRDDDRFWKAGLVYVNRDDPALMVNARVTFAWTPNLGNPRVWLIIAGVAASLAGLIAVTLTVGL